MDSAAGTVGQVVGAGTAVLNEMQRFLPEPQRSVSSIAGRALALVGDVVGGSIGGLPFEYQTMLNEQIRVQREMQVVSMFSNIEKSKHETLMVALRNMRAS